MENKPITLLRLARLYDAQQRTHPLALIPISLEINFDPACNSPEVLGNVVPHKSHRVRRNRHRKPRSIPPSAIHQFPRFNFRNTVTTCFLGQVDTRGLDCRYDALKIFHGVKDFPDRLDGRYRHSDLASGLFIVTKTSTAGREPRLVATRRRLKKIPDELAILRKDTLQTDVRLSSNGQVLRLLSSSKP
ncbi:hypothetical protein SCHPADRAFT_530280 [Schizopora paradoxa]|uniref:Uncharacterized protein n=1 Tax=Schizopora paradoxa TaxID=27342 RepID=A0A0H2REG5_9AGAM|nr:hypothetical protein SCHPADRAFT_530280 [Schizopora paradoxa]